MYLSQENLKNRRNFVINPAFQFGARAQIRTSKEIRIAQNETLFFFTTFFFFPVDTIINFWLMKEIF